jgi:hypothetical protein
MRLIHNSKRMLYYAMELDNVVSRQAREDSKDDPEVLALLSRDPRTFALAEQGPDPFTLDDLNGAYALGMRDAKMLFLQQVQVLGERVQESSAPMDKAAVGGLVAEVMEPAVHVHMLAMAEEAFFAELRTEALDDHDMPVLPYARLQALLKEVMEGIEKAPSADKEQADQEAPDAAVEVPSAVKEQADQEAPDAAVQVPSAVKEQADQEAPEAAVQVPSAVKEQADQEAQEASVQAPSAAQQQAPSVAQEHATSAAQKQAKADEIRAKIALLKEKMRLQESAKGSASVAPVSSPADPGLKTPQGAQGADR